MGRELREISSKRDVSTQPLPTKRETRDQQEGAYAVGGTLTWAEFDREGSTGSQDGVTDGEAGGIFVALQGGSIVFELNDFADQLVPADFDQLVHLGAAHVLSDDKGTSDLEDFTVLRRLLFKISICHFAISFLL